MKKQILFVMLSILMISLVQAEKVNTNININVQCSNSTYSNITSIIHKTNSEYILKGEYGMTKSGTNYNYTLSSTLNDEIGILEVNYHCDVNGVDTTAGYFIDITSTGQQVSLSNIIIVIAFLFIAGILFLLGYTFGKDQFILKSAFYLFSLIMLLISLNSGRIIASESTGLDTMSIGALILLISVIAFFFLYIFIMWTVNTFKLFKTKKEMRWKY